MHMLAFLNLSSENPKIEKMRYRFIAFFLKFKEAVVYAVCVTIIHFISSVPITFLNHKESSSFQVIGRIIYFAIQHTKNFRCYEPLKSLNDIEWRVPFIWIFCGNHLVVLYT
jgi:hypothetical protein